MNKTIIAVAATFVLAACAVTIDGSQSGTGALTGGVLGGIAGSSRSHGAEQAAIGVIGAVAGAVIGNTVERAATKEEAVEILVQLRNGERRAIVQGKGGETLNPGEAVILVTSGGRTRVTRAPAVVPNQSAPIGSPAPKG
jgi:outer membrane lipoprotein SlyB